MLKIVMGIEYAEEYVGDKKFMWATDSIFNRRKKKEWFKDKFVQEIIMSIDKAYVETDYAVHSLEYDYGYSVDDLAGGSKTLILIYEVRDRVFLANMGDNCTDFMERIALSYEEEGKDLIIVSNSLNKFKFNYIDSIEYLNYGITCHSTRDIWDNIEPLWNEQERPIREEQTYEEWVAEMEELEKSFKETWGIK